MPTILQGLLNGLSPLQESFSSKRKSARPRSARSSTINGTRAVVYRIWSIPTLRRFSSIFTPARIGAFGQPSGRLRTRRTGETYPTATSVSSPRRPSRTRRVYPSFEEMDDDVTAQPFRRGDLHLIRPPTIHEVVLPDSSFGISLSLRT